MGSGCVPGAFRVSGHPDDPRKGPGKGEESSPVRRRYGMARVRNTPLTAGLRGRIGEAVYVQGTTGTQLRRRPQRVGALTPGQIAAAERMETIGYFWSLVDLQGVERWRDYAVRLQAMLPALERRPMNAYQAFLQLATRLLMIDSTADLPLLPPSAAFAGDAVAVVGEPFATADPTPTPPEGEEIRFLANRPNAPGVLTELLFQRLASVGRAPVGTKYRSQRFVAFSDGGLEAMVPCAVGWYALAYRFVDAGTGQATGVFPCGIVRVGSSA